MGVKVSVQFSIQFSKYGDKCYKGYQIEIFITATNKYYQLCSFDMFFVCKTQ